ncbi:VWA domain-containing protein, partial [Micromonospora azadirachtae]
MRSKIPGVAAAASATALVVVAAGAWFGYRELIQPSCSGQIKLSVAVSAELAPAVDAAAGQWVSDGAAVGGTCIAVDVIASEPVDVAAVVAGMV